MKKGLFTAAVIAAMMMTQPVMAQEVVEQTGEVVQQTEEDVSESDMAAVIRWKQFGCRDKCI